MQYTIQCPCCGKNIYIEISKAGELLLGFCDLYEDSETYEVVRSCGYEFGTTDGKEV